MDNFGKRPTGPSTPAQAPQVPSAQPAPSVAPTSPFAISDIPPKRPLGPLPNSSQPPTEHAPQPIETPPEKPRKKTKKKLIFGLMAGLVAVCAVVIAGGWFWYNAQLAPVDANNSDKIAVVVESGSTPTQIAALLASEQLIRSADVFLWYTRLEGVQNNLQAGTYRLSPSESTQAIVEHLTNGTVDTFDITFLPGATLAQNREAFIKAGYSEQEVDTALAATYDSPLFEGKPASADLEGYIYGDTYRFGSGESVQNILTHVFEAFYKVVQDNNLVAGYEAQGLSLYEGITLASIIQREAIGGDEAQIAQVFFTRLADGMPLGSDVTYQYIADKTGVPRDTNLDSPYNTRRYAGLPPGPIAVPGVASLKAVAQPAEGSYVYFLSGDDDVTYFATTLEEHEANIRNHCQQKCQIL